MAIASGTGIRLRIGYAEDFTTLPIVYTIEQTVKGGALRRCGEMREVRSLFESGDLDLALIPAADALRLPNVEIVPCSAISALGGTRSFMIFSKKIPTEIGRVLVDHEDYGMASLAKLLMAKKLMIRPEVVVSNEPLDPAQRDLTQQDGYDAYLLTGRNALSVRKEAFAFTWDLTLAWYEYSRLPFTVHCWAVKKGCRIGRLDKELGEVARRNDARMEGAARSAEKFGISGSKVTAIYGKAFFTEFNNNTLTSLRKFGQELQQNRIQPVSPLNVYTEATNLRKPMSV